MPFFLRRRSIVYLCVTLALLLSVIAASFLLGVREQAEQDAVKRSLEVQLHLSRVLSLVQDAETGQRGYLLTHNEAYLDPYNAAVPAIDGEIAALHAVMVGNNRDTTLLEALASNARAKLGELSETISLARAGKADAALALVQTDRGKDAMDRIRDAVQAISADERGILSDEQARTLRTSYFAALDDFGRSRSGDPSRRPCPS